MILLQRSRSGNRTRVTQPELTLLSTNPTLLLLGNFEFSLEDAIPMAELTVMFIFSGEAFWRCLQLWLLMHSIGGLWLIFSTLTTTHHHPGVRLVSATFPLFQKICRGYDPEALLRICPLKFLEAVTEPRLVTKLFH